MAVTASLVINFGDVTDAYLSAEILDDDNEGKTSFSAGDTVYFRIYHSGTFDVISNIGSTSEVSANQTQNIKELTDDGNEEMVTFAFSGTASTDKLISNFISGEWVGTELGTIAKSGHAEVSGGIKSKDNGGTGLPDSVGVAKIDYDTKYDLWQFNSPSDVDGSTTYTAVIGITATS